MVPRRPAASPGCSCFPASRTAAAVRVRTTFDALTATTDRVTKGEAGGRTAVKVGKRVNGNRANGKRVVTKAKN